MASRRIDKLVIGLVMVSFALLFFSELKELFYPTIDNRVTEIELSILPPITFALPDKKQTYYKGLFDSCVHIKGIRRVKQVVISSCFGLVQKAIDERWYEKQQSQDWIWPLP